MAENYTGLEGCEDLWELLRSVYQNTGLLKGWLQYFKNLPIGNNDPIIECENAIEASEALFESVKRIYSRVFVAL